MALRAHDHHQKIVKLLLRISWMAYWYLSTNLRNSNNLNTHLLPNVNTIGIPKNFKNQSYGFKFNDIKEFKKIIQKNKLAAVIMEVSRLKETKKVFLKKFGKLLKKEYLFNMMSVLQV